MGTKAKSIIAVVVILAVLLYWHQRNQGESVQSFQQRVIAECNQELLNPDNPIRKRIEDAHMTVTVKSASVTSCNVQTVDGSDHAGLNDRNISEIDVVITLVWDGWIQKDGYTEFEVSYDYQNKTVKETKYLKSNALINMETVDWFSVGYSVGEFLASF